MTIRLDHPTDPDAFLMIEARKILDRLEWRYTLVRFCSHCSLSAAHNGHEIWQVDVLPTKVILDSKQPYFALRKYSDFPVVK